MSLLFPFSPNKTNQFFQPFLTGPVFWPFTSFVVVLLWAFSSFFTLLKSDFRTGHYSSEGLE